MPTGIIRIDETGCLVRLLDTLTAAQGAPADGVPGSVLSARPTSTQFYDLGDLRAQWLAKYGVPFTWPDAATVSIYETTGSGTMTIAYARLWLYTSSSQKAFPAGTGADATKGYLGGGAAGVLGETGANRVRHMEPLVFPGQCDGINIELGTYGDASQRHTVEIFFPAPASTNAQLQQAAMVRLLCEMRDLLADIKAKRS